MKKTGSAAKRKGYQPLECGQLFVVLNEYAQVWTGIKGDELAFSDDWNEAKPLENENQFLGSVLAEKELEDGIE